MDKALLPVLESAGPACGLRFEWSVNEAVLAAKVLGRATLTHSRGFGFMKNIGLNVALDALSTMSIKSTFNSGTLFLVSADPQPHRSHRPLRTTATSCPRFTSRCSSRGPLRKPFKGPGRPSISRKGTGSRSLCT